MLTSPDLRITRHRGGLPLGWLVLCTALYPCGQLVTFLTGGEFCYVSLCTTCGAEQVSREKELFGFIPVGTERRVNETPCQRFMRARFRVECSHPRWEFGIGGGGGVR